MIRQLCYRNLRVEVDFREASRATWQMGSSQREVRLICLHSAECKEVPNAAEALQSWASGTAHPKGASWHFAVDSNSITQSVEIHDIAWHAGPINGYSVGIEQAGFAKQSADEWDDEYSRAMLERTAQLVALLAGLYDLPIEHAVNPKDPKSRGICTHADVSSAWKVRSGHWDPGPNYPIERVLERARQIQLEAVS